MDLIPGLGRSSRKGNGNPRQYSCLRNPMDRVTQQTTIHGVTKNQTQLNTTQQHKLKIMCVSQELLTVNIMLSINITQGLPRWFSGKESVCQCWRCSFNPCIGTFPWRRKYQCTPVFLPWKSHGQRSMAGYSPWGRKESGMTETTQQQHRIMCI